MKNNNYILQLAEKSTCSKCHKYVELLIRENGGGPIFYICFDCRRVFQAGNGEVKRE